MNFYTSCIVWLILLVACTQNNHDRNHRLHAVTAIDDPMLKNPMNEQGDWITHGLNYQEDRFSPLTDINKSNIDSLDLAWSLELDTKRGLEATPLAIDGILYFTGDWSKVYAIDAIKGALIWKYDPKVHGKYGEKVCCDVVNRGVAAYKGNVYVGTIDGRLIALDAATGKETWSILTVDTALPYTITGAPRIVHGKVIIGNAGAEYGVRGYVSAYDALTGHQVWRFYTVPGDTSKPFENKAMRDAAKTWYGEWWKYGGGGTVWDAMAFDPTLNLLYIGTGNGSPWDRNHRSPGGGDNLYLSSILALNPDNGELRWYYQTTPGDSWDFTATQHIILADMNIKGEERKILMQAPKNGFFYVIDRTNGQLISADPFVYTNWAKSVDLKSGRPIETDFARYEKVNADIAPVYNGGHNWQPMAYNKNTGLVYIPARDNVAQYGHDPDWIFNKRGFGTGNGWNLSTGNNPRVPNMEDTVGKKNAPRGFLSAWNPVEKNEKWRINQKTDWAGGLLTTASDLLFQGDPHGDFICYDAESGNELWKRNLGGGILAPPIAYKVNGKEYITVLVGWGGGYGMKNKFTALQPGRVFTFSIGSKNTYPKYITGKTRKIVDLPVSANQFEINRGRNLFRTYCSICHVVGANGGGLAPDLIYSTPVVHQSFIQIVRDGLLLPSGMPKFSGRLSDQDILDIQGYVLSRALEERSMGK